MLDGLRHGLRFMRVAHALARHDALFWVRDIGPAPAMLKAAILLVSRFARRRRGLSEDEGERLAAALRSLGPAYIKLGQMLRMGAQGGADVLDHPAVDQVRQAETLGGRQEGAR